MSERAVRNAYPELPVLTFERTSVAMADVVRQISSAAVTVPIKRAAYVIFRNESGNGRKGINNNFIGLQADGNRVEDKWIPFIIGTCVRAENRTGRRRRFVCFENWTTSVDFLADKVSARGLYVGGYAHEYAKMKVETDDDWPLAYWREWVKGSRTARIPRAKKDGLLSQYRDAIGHFPSI